MKPDTLWIVAVFLLALVVGFETMALVHQRRELRLLRAEHRSVREPEPSPHSDAHISNVTVTDNWIRHNAIKNCPETAPCIVIGRVTDPVWVNAAPLTSTQGER